MRVFVFGIGGTGARVITQLVMHLSAGVRPVGEDGQILKDDFSIVPILVDPHAECEALVSLGELLNDYRTIHNRLYGGVKDPGRGFFSVKIETMHDVDPSVTHDDFTFRLSNISNKSFKNYIGKDLMKPENSLFMDFLFSNAELNTEMSEGFYGSPNIGCVALNSFRDSADFAAFKKNIRSTTDKVFFIGSIFGGTGASGLPLFVSNIRHMLRRGMDDAENSGKSPIGTLIVMPYFKIGDDKSSPINDSDFMVKTRSALSYYESNMNNLINNIYYIADWGDKTITPFENDPGDRDNQKGNKAHIVEYMGAAALFDFIKSDNRDVNDDGTVPRTQFKAYGIDSDDENIGTITFKEFGGDVKDFLRLPYMKFVIMKHYMEHHLSGDGQKPYASNHNPKIETSIVNNAELQRIFRKFDLLIDQMHSHGSAAHNLSFFNSISGDDYTAAFNNIGTKTGVLGRKKKVEKNDILKALNKQADEQKNSLQGINTGEQRWFRIADVAIENVIKELYELNN